MQNQNYLQLLERAIEVLNKGNIISIIIPREDDLDSIASATALYLSLLKLNKKPSLVCKNPIDVPLIAANKFSSNLTSEGEDLIISLPYKEGAIDRVDYNIKSNKFNLIVMMNKGFQKIKKEEVKFSYTGSNIDTFMVINSSSLPSLGEIYEDNKEIFEGKEIINIDRHFTNTKYGTVNLVETSVASLSEIIFDLLKKSGITIDKDIATNLYNGILAGTKNFTSYSVTPHTLESAAELLRKGAIKKRLSTSPPRQPFNIQPKRELSQKIFEKKEEKVKNITKEKENTNDTTTPTDWLKPKIFKGGTV